MPRESSDDLFLLIHSLVQAEKGYIKKFSFRNSTKGENLYLRLFDAIEKQKNYDEKALLNTVKGIVNLPNLKHYLYHAILRGINAYHENNNVHIQLKSLISSIEILYDKGLYKQGSKLLARAEKMARQFELYPELSRILQLQKKISSNINSNLEETESNLKRILDAEEENIQKQNSIIKYSKIYASFLFDTLKEISIRNSTLLKHFQKYKPYLSIPKEEEKALPYEAKIYYYGFLSRYYSFREDRESSFYYNHKIVTLTKEASELNAGEKRRYFSSLYNYLSDGAALGKYREMNEQFAEIRMLRKEFITDTELQEKLFPLYNMELLYYIKTGDYRIGTEFIPEVLSALKQYSVPREVLPEFYFNIAHLYFGAAEYSRSLQWIRKILEDTSNIRDDIHCVARMIYLLIHYELENSDVLESIVKSTYRFLYKRKMVFRFESSILNFIRKKLPLITNSRQSIDAFKELKAELMEIFKDDYERKVLEDFNYIAWLESKIEKKSFEEIVKQKLIEKL